MQTLVEIGSDGASPQIGEIQPFCDFSDCPTFFLDPSYRSNRWADFLRFMAQTTCIHAMTVLLGVRTIDDVIWGKYAPKTPQKGA